MKSTLRRTTLSRLTTVAALALVSLLAIGTTASAATQTVTYKVRASAAGQTAESTMTQGIDATAPATVPAGAAFQVVVDPTQNTIPSSSGGYTIREIKNFTLKVPVPANSTFVSVALSGGSNIGATPPTASLQGSDIVLKLAGPIKGGSTFELPTLTINLKAGSAGTITTRLGGTSHSSPGLTFTAVVPVLGFPVDAAATAYPDPNPALTTTSIS